MSPLPDVAIFIKALAHLIETYSRVGLSQPVELGSTGLPDWIVALGAVLVRCEAHARAQEQSA
jgi:hypothetical protein